MVAFFGSFRYTVAMLTVKNLSVSIGKKKILQDVSYTFEKGKIYAVMGPNGSGKSTLASTIMGHPSYTISPKSAMVFENKNIAALTADKRAKLGIFMSFQSPMSLSGVNIHQLLLYALSGKMEPLAMRQKVQACAKMLKIDSDLLSRSLNEGFSGGEKKKMEVLQAAILDPKLAIFDEIDTGVDVDALRAISTFLKKLKDEGKTFILITHYNRILKYLKPDTILVLVGGKLVKTGDAKLANRIEKEGYDNLSS